MNERIKELMDQAFEGIQVVDEIEEYHLEKFAELLIRECALQCVHNEDMDLIEKHFGVEL